MAHTISSSGLHTAEQSTERDSETWLHAVCAAPPDYVALMCVSIDVADNKRLEVIQDIVTLLHINSTVKS